MGSPPKTMKLILLLAVIGLCTADHDEDASASFIPENKTQMTLDEYKYVTFTLVLGEEYACGADDNDMDDTNVTSTTQSSLITTEAPFNFTVNVQNRRTAVSHGDIIEVSEITSELVCVNGTQEITVDFRVDSKDKYGRGLIVLSIQWIPQDVDEETHTTEYHYEVHVGRRPSKYTTQTTLNYILLVMTMLLFFLSGCMMKSDDILDNLTWIMVAVLFSTVFIPVICMALIQLFKLGILSKMGIISSMTGPCGLITVAFAVLLDANIVLTAVISIILVIVSNGSMPLWILQMGRMTGILFVPLDIPYAALVVMFLCSIFFFVLGVLVQKKLDPLARLFTKILVPLSLICILYDFFATIAGGYDLFYTLEWQVGMVVFVYVLILLVVFCAVYKCSSESNVPQLKAVGIVLLIRGPTIPYEMLSSAIQKPDVDISATSSFFFSLVTLLTACMLTAVYILAFFLSKDEHNSEKNDLVVEINAEGEKPQMELYDFNTKENKRLKDDLENQRNAMLTATATVNSWGAPVLYVPMM